MNIQHSSRTDQWFTPVEILTRVHEVLGHPDLDPASCAEANERVQARQYFSEGALEKEWPAGSVFCNPPGGKLGNKSKTALFWKKFMEMRATGALTHGIFLCFSLEALQTTQSNFPSVGEFVLCVPKQRIPFDRPDGSKGDAPSHSNVIAYVPGTVDERERFIAAFSSLGVILNRSVQL